MRFARSISTGGGLKSSTRPILAGVPADQMVQNVSLAFGDPADVHSQRVRPRLGHAAASQGGAQKSYKGSLVERFLAEVAGPELHRLDRARRIFVPRHHDDRPHRMGRDPAPAAPD